MNKTVFNQLAMMRLALAAAALLAVLLTRPLPAGAELVDRIVAVANDDIILLSELEEAMRTIAAGLDQQGYSQSQKSRILNEQRPAVLGQLIDDKLTDQQVARYNIQVDDDDVDITIQRILSVNRMTEDDLKRALKLDGMTFEEYRQHVRTRVLRQRLLASQVQSKIVVTDSDIEAYYNANRELYAGFTKYDLRHILMRTSPGGDPEEKEQVRQQIHDVHKRLQDGEDFGQLAELYSQAGSAAQAGRLGVFGAKSLTEEVRKALKGLAEKEFTDVLDTEQGYQIFLVEKIISSGGKSLAASRDEIQDKLFADLVDKNFRTWLEELRRRSHIQIMQ